MAGRARRQVLGMLALVLGTAMVPGLVLAALRLEDGSTVAVFGALTGLITSLSAGPRVAAAVVAALAVLSAAVVAVDQNPWLLSLLMAASAAAVALSSRRGISSGLMLAPVALAFTASEPPLAQFEAPERSLLVLAMSLGSGLFAILVAHVAARAVRLPEAEHASRSRALAYAIVLAVLVGVATWIVVDSGLGHTGGWLIMTILLVVQPFLQDAWHISVQRAGGTMLGFLVALAFTAVAGLPIVIYVAGGLFMFAALVMKVEKRPYWLYAALVTPAVVLLEGTSGAMAETAVQRLVATLIGAGASLVAIIVLKPLYARGAKRFDLEHW